MSSFIEDPAPAHHKKCQNKCGLTSGPMLKCLNLKVTPCPNVIHVKCLEMDEEFARHLEKYFCVDCTTSDDDLHTQMTAFEKEAKLLCQLRAAEKRETATQDQQYQQLREASEKLSSAYEDLRKKYDQEVREKRKLQQQLVARQVEHNELLTRIRALENAKSNIISSTITDKIPTKNVTQLSPNSFVTHLNDTLHIVGGRESRESEVVEDKQAGATTSSASTTQYVTRESIAWPDYANQSSMAERVGETTLMLARACLAKPVPFSGDVTQWSTFLSEFLRTSNRGHYRDFEDLDRLRELIQGEARNMFLAELMDPCADTISTLKRLDNFFGVRGNAVRVALDRVTQMAKVEKPHHKENIIKLYTNIKHYAMQCRFHCREHELSSQATLFIFETKMCAEHAFHWRSWARNNGRSEDTDAMIAYLEEQIQDLNLRPSRNPKQTARVNATEVTGGPSNSHSTGRGSEPGSHSARRGGDAGSSRNSEQYQNREEKRKKRYANSPCFLCKDLHPFYRCPKFIGEDVATRQQIVERLHICKRCLSNDKHKAQDCHNKCLKCFEPGCRVKNINYLLHNHSRSTTERDAATTSESCNQLEARVEKAQSHFAMVPGHAIAQDGRRIETTIMFDLGSGISLASKSLFREAQCQALASYELTLHWATNKTHYEDDVKLFQLEFVPLGHDKPVLLQNLSAVAELDLPTQTQNPAVLKNAYQHLKNVPIPKYQSQKPQILLGLPHSSLITPMQSIFGHKPSDPVAALTRLGWTVYGRKHQDATSRPSFRPSLVNVIRQESSEGDVTNEELLKFVQRYHKLENIGIAHTDASLLSAEDQAAAAEMEVTLQFREDIQRYEAALLWKKEIETMPDNYDEAVARLRSTERRLQKLDMVEFVNKQFTQHITEGLLVETTREEANRHAKRNYVYGFLTFNYNKQPPKPRWVNDTAAKFKGVSLNSCLMKGPDNMVPLPQAMCAMREGKIAFQADVKSMFNQIALREEDQFSQLTLWRDCNSETQPKIYRQTRVIFGPTCAPAIANGVRKKHAQASKDEFPEAADVAEHQMYVDDAPESCDTVQEAGKIANDLIKMFERISWPLVQFQSNSQELLKLLPPENVSEKNYLVTNDDEERITKVLGIYWKAVADVYVFRLNDDTLVKKCTDASYIPTKREMLSTVMRFFDPTGMVSPFRIRGQIIMQQVWRAGTDWNQQPPPEITENFIEWLREFDMVTKLEIPRAYCSSPLKTARLELHALCDASPEAYAACIYIRIITDDSITVRLVASKAKVAPLKYVSVPRLELMAALLGARLLTAVKMWHRRLKFEESFCWTDSEVVFKWIRAVHLPRTNFTAPRITEIQELTSADHWFYVPTASNVADYGTKNRQLDHSDAQHEWHTGPEFLYRSRNEWPKQPQTVSFPMADATMCVVKPLENGSSFLAGVLHQVSSKIRSQWPLYVRVVAKALRFTDRCASEKIAPKTPKHRRDGHITAWEFERAENYVIRAVQRAVYPEDFERLEDGKHVRADSPIASLAPAFCRRTNLIRATTRLSNNFPFNMRCPPILPNFNEVTDAIVEHFHKMYLHVGDNTIVAALRSRVWITNARRAVKRCRARCQKCVEGRRKVEIPRQADLPDLRFDIKQKPFFHTGVDLFGPYKVFSGKSKFTKEVHGVIFTCLVTRAVYLEVLDDQSTECFLIALNKLWTRRGPISHMYSDNGRNFVGAASIINNDNFQRSLLEKKLKWHFIPAFTPQFGGTWERLIKDIKRSLDASIGKFVVPRRTFDLALVQIESNLNNRPLTELPVSTHEDSPLTPYILMTGHPNYPLNDEDSGSRLTADVDISKLKTAGRANALVQLFRSRFIQEYAPVISRRPNSPKRKGMPLKLGDFVVYLDPTKSTNLWPTGVISRVYPGRDSNCRVVDVKLKSGGTLLRRSVYRLAKIDLRRESDAAEQNKYSAALNIVQGEWQRTEEKKCERSVRAREAMSKRVNFRVFDDSTKAAFRGEQRIPEEDLQQHLDREGTKTIHASNLPAGLGCNDIFSVLVEFGQVRAIIVPRWSNVAAFSAIICYANESAVRIAEHYNESLLVTVGDTANRLQFKKFDGAVVIRKVFKKPRYNFAEIKDEFNREHKVLVIRDFRHPEQACPLIGGTGGFVNCCPPSHRYNFRSCRVDLTKGTGAIRSLPFVAKEGEAAAVNVTAPTTEPMEVEGASPPDSRLSTNTHDAQCQIERTRPFNLSATETKSNNKDVRAEREIEREGSFRAIDPCQDPVEVRVKEYADLRQMIKDRRSLRQHKRIIPPIEVVHRDHPGSRSSGGTM